MNKEKLTPKQLQFIIDNNFNLEFIKRQSFYHQNLGGWVCTSTKNSYFYIQFVKSKFEPLLNLIFDVQPELSKLKNQLFKNIQSHHSFESHFVKTFSNLVYFETLKHKIFSSPYNGLSVSDRRKYLSDFIQTSESIRPLIHQHLLENVKKNKTDIPLFQSYISNLELIPLNNPTDIEDFFSIVKCHNPKIPSETQNKESLEKIINTLEPTEFVKEHIQDIFQPYFNYQHKVSKIYNAYLQTHFNTKISTPKKLIETNKKYLLSFEINTSFIIEKFPKMQGHEAHTISNLFLEGLVSSLKLLPEFKNQPIEDGDGVHFVDTNSTTTVNITVVDIDLFNLISKKLEHIDEISQSVINFAIYTLGQESKKTKNYSSVDFTSLISRHTLFNHLEKNIRSHPVEKQSFKI